MKASKAIDLFSKLVEESKLHPQFKALRNSPIHGNARKLINNFYNRMGDPNGNFLRDFQSNAFHSRLFEIACYAYFDSSDIECDRSFEKPDFIVSRNGITVSVEAVTANPTEGRSQDISLAKLENIPFDEMVEKCENDFPIRMANILRKKLAHKYWELPHCLGKPLIYIIAPFFEAGSVLYGAENLAVYLYGLVDKHEYNGRRVASGFFNEKNSQHVSAVIYCNQFTVPRFYRMTVTPDDIKSVKSIREGFCYIPVDESTLRISEYRYAVGSSTEPTETWWQGVTIFYNPNALVPLPEGFFRATNIYGIEGDYVVQTVKDFHPLTSMMWQYPNK